MFNFKNLFKSFKKSSSQRKEERQSQQVAELQRLTTYMQIKSAALEAKEKRMDAIINRLSHESVTSVKAEQPLDSTKSSVEPATKPAIKPDAKPDDKPVIAPDTKPATKPATKPVAKPVAKPDAKPVAKPATKFDFDLFRKLASQPKVSMNEAAALLGTSRTAVWNATKKYDIPWVRKQYSATKTLATVDVQDLKPRILAAQALDLELSLLDVQALYPGNSLATLLNFMFESGITHFHYRKLDRTKRYVFTTNMQCLQSVDISALAKNGLKGSQIQKLSNQPTSTVYARSHKDLPITLHELANRISSAAKSGVFYNLDAIKHLAYDPDVSIQAASTQLNVGLNELLFAIAQFGIDWVFSDVSVASFNGSELFKKSPKNFSATLFYNYIKPKDIAAWDTVSASAISHRLKSFQKENDLPSLPDQSKSSQPSIAPDLQVNAVVSLTSPLLTAANLVSIVSRMQIGKPRIVAKFLATRVGRPDLTRSYTRVYVNTEQLERDYINFTQNGHVDEEVIIRLSAKLNDDETFVVYKASQTDLEALAPEDLPQTISVDDIGKLTQGYDKAFSVIPPKHFKHLNGHTYGISSANLIVYPKSMVPPLAVAKALTPFKNEVYLVLKKSVNLTMTT